MFAKAVKEFLSKLPDEMIMLVLEAVDLQDQLNSTTDKQVHDDIQHKLELINRRIIQSATNMF
ncbi:MAG: hypothetical protein IJ201_08635 [Solobacterium sp.]|nr:hypothetical protein [Solobacterium sp.]